MRLPRSFVPILKYSLSRALIDVEPQLANDLQGKTFSRVFGATTALFERFVLDRKVMGPCWLQIVDPDFSKAQNVPFLQYRLTKSQPGRVLNLASVHQIKLLLQRLSPLLLH